MVRVREEVVRQHAEDAAYLGEQRRLANNSTISDLPALTRLEARLDIHAHALQRLGLVAWEIARPAWATRLPGECFTALRLAFGLGYWTCVDELLDSLGLLEHENLDNFEQLDACVMALAWLPRARALEVASWWLSREDPLRWSLGLAGMLAHRIDFGAGLGPALRRGFNHPSAWTRACACWGAALLGLPIDAQTESDACARVRLFTQLAALRQHRPDTARHRALVELAVHTPEFGDLACALGFAGLSPTDIDAAIARLLSGQIEHRRLALVGIVGVGDPIYVPWVLDCLDDPHLGLAASHALVALTGVEPDAAGLIGAPPPTLADGDAEIPLAEPDIDSPWLDPAAARSWWTQHSGEFPAGQRVLFGATLPGALRSAIVHAPQRVRALAAWRLGLTRPGAIFALDAPAWRQLQWLTRLGAA